MKRRYKVIATVEGNMPSNPIIRQKDVDTFYSKCQRGWPDKQWAVFQYTFDIEGSRGQLLESEVLKSPVEISDTVVVEVAKQTLIKLGFKQEQKALF